MHEGICTFISGYKHAITDMYTYTKHVVAVRLNVTTVSAFIHLTISLFLTSVLNNVNLRLPTVHRLIYSLIGAAFVSRGVEHCCICENKRGSGDILMINKRARKSVASAQGCRQVARVQRGRHFCAESSECGDPGNIVPLSVCKNWISAKTVAVWARSRVNSVIWSNPVGLTQQLVQNPRFLQFFNWLLAS